MTQEWEEKYPLVKAKSITRVGSDHTPIIVESKIELKKEKPFRFDMAWLVKDGVKELIIEKWPTGGECRFKSIGRNGKLK